MFEEGRHVFPKGGRRLLCIPIQQVIDRNPKGFGNVIEGLDIDRNFTAFIF